MPEGWASGRELHLSPSPTIPVPEPPTHGHSTSHVSESAWCSAVFIKLAIGGAELARYRAPLSLTLGNVSITLADHTATITTPEWSVSAKSRYRAGIQRGTSCATGKCHLEITMKPRIDVDSSKVAPHGLLGQLYDGDDLAIVGKTDVYKGAEMTTEAMGEGAIEGVAADYQVADKFATNFTYSRFGKSEAPPRNVSALTGAKVKGRITGGMRGTDQVVEDAKRALADVLNPEDTLGR